MPKPLTIALSGDLEIVMTRAFDAPRELVFLCYSKPELVSRWLLGPPGWTMPVCEIDFRVGGKWRFLYRSVDGVEMSTGGVYREISRPERIANTEVFEPDWTGGETVATVSFSEANGRTTATTTVHYSSREAREAAAASPMATGLEASYRQLDGLLEEHPA